MMFQVEFKGHGHFTHGPVVDELIAELFSDLFTSTNRMDSVFDSHQIHSWLIYSCNSMTVTFNHWIDTNQRLVVLVNQLIWWRLLVNALDDEWLIANFMAAVTRNHRLPVIHGHRPLYGFASRDQITE